MNELLKVLEQELFEEYLASELSRYGIPVSLQDEINLPVVREAFRKGFYMYEKAQERVLELRG